MPVHQISKSVAPLPRTYWVIDELFLAGAYAGKPDPRASKERLSGMFNAGIRTFVNLMEENESNNVGKPFVRYDDLIQTIASDANERVECLRFPIVDGHITTNERMRSILDAIDGSHEKKQPVYVHCFGGIGRTGTVVCCWLLRHGYATRSKGARHLLPSACLPVSVSRILSCSMEGGNTECWPLVIVASLLNNQTQ